MMAIIKPVCTVLHDTTAVTRKSQDSAINILTLTLTLDSYFKLPCMGLLHCGSARSIIGLANYPDGLQKSFVISA